jgi:hypothetical protein
VVEHFLGKEEVPSSILGLGSTNTMFRWASSPNPNNPKHLNSLAGTIHVDKMTGAVSSLGAYDDKVLKDGTSAKKQLSKAVIGIGNPDAWKKVLEKHGPQAQATPRYQEPSSINGPIDFGPSAHGN